MRIVKLKGGLGNQMFQYAYAKLIEKRTGDTVKLDFSAYDFLEKDTVRKPRLTRFSLTLQNATKHDLASICKLQHRGNSLSLRYKAGILLEIFLNRKYAFEPNRAYINPANLDNKQYFDGYWQSYRYIDEVIDILEKDFKPNAPLSKTTVDFQEQIRNQNAIFIGVRKGDYTEHLSHYGSFDSIYYQKAMQIIDAKVENPIYYVFSNDIQWCKDNIDWKDHNIIYREPSDQVDDFEELMLMASCKHAIIVNSTYHWWGATLINNPNKIICCPNKWFFDDAPIDIIPSNWHRIQ